jgi:hypothetical protein
MVGKWGEKEGELLIPDVDVEMESPIKLSEIQKVMSSIVDGHVM